MNEFEKLYTEKISNTLNMSPEETKECYEEFRTAAVKNPAAFISFLHSIDLCSDNYVWEIYECLSEEPQPWKELFVNEISRLISASQSKPEFASQILSSLEGISLSNHPIIAKCIMASLLHHADSPILSIRRRVIWSLSGYQEIFGITEISLFQDILQNDSDWRIRNFARYSLIDRNALPSNFSEPLIDLIRRKLFVEFKF